MTLPQGTRLGSFEILGLVGSGGMGEVYRARDTNLDRDVAIKILPAAFASDREMRERFEREAKAVAALSHPNILAIHDFGIGDGRAYAVMELLEGSSLRDVMAGGPVPARKAVDYCGQAARGLAAAHDKGIIHRDVKPENLFLTNDGHVKILDFGLATYEASSSTDLTQSPTSGPRTGAGTILGTVGYMSPEQARGQRADHRSDIFSLGCVLYELLSGQRPFQRDSAPETLTAILREDPAPLSQHVPSVPPALEQLVLHCLEKRAEDRFQSARDLAFALQALSGSGIWSGIQPAAGAAPRPDRPARVHWLVVVGAALGLLAVGTVAGWQLLPRPSPAPRPTRLTFDRGNVTSARFAPDGKTIVYGATWGGSPVRMFQTRPGSPESTALQLPDADILSISSAGEMAISPGRVFNSWMASGGLARAPLVGGLPRAVLDDVRGADWSPDGKDLAIVRRVGGKDRLEYPIGKILYETAGYLGDLRIAPGGDGVAFMDHPAFADNRGFVAFVTWAGEFRRLGREWAGEGGLAWSADGREIWFTAGDTTDTFLSAVTRDGRYREVYRPPTGIVLLDVSPDGRVLLSRTAALRADIAWMGPEETRERDISWLSLSMPVGLSGDGRSVLLQSFDYGGGSDYKIGLRRVNDPGTVPLGTGGAVQLSADGKWVLSISPSDRSRLVVLPVGAGETKVLSAPGLKYYGAGWLPDGKRLIVVAGTDPGRSAAYVQEVDGGVPRAIPGNVTVPDGGVLTSPDGQWFIARQRQSPPVQVQVDSGKTRRLPNLSADDVPVAVSTDGKALFVARGDLESRMLTLIVRYNLASASVEIVKRIEPADAAGVMARPDCLVTADGRTIVYVVNRYLNDLYLVEGLK